MPRPHKNAGWSLAKKTFLKKKKKRTPPPRASSDDDSDDEAFARRLAAARAAREQQRHPDASSSDDEAWQDARRRAGAAPAADASPPPALGPPARARLAAAGPTTWAEAEPLDRDWGRGEGVGDGGLLWDDDAEGPAADDPLGLGLRGGVALHAPHALRCQLLRRYLHLRLREARRTHHAILRLGGAAAAALSGFTNGLNARD